MEKVTDLPTKIVSAETLQEKNKIVIGLPVPSVGRMVHYYAYGTPGGEFPVGEARAAIVTAVATPGDPGSNVSLVVFNPTGQWFNTNVPHGAPGVGGHWGWPPRVDEAMFIVDDQVPASGMDLSEAVRVYGRNSEGFSIAAHIEL